MKSLILLASLFLVSESFAEALPTCRIDSLKHAELCMKKVAKFMPEYEEPNEGVVSLQKESMVKVLKAIGEKRSQKYKLVNEADYIGMMIEHGDETVIYYYALKNGLARPVVISEINVADLDDEIKSPISAKDFLLGKKITSDWVMEDIQNALNDSKYQN